MTVRVCGMPFYQPADCGTTTGEEDDIMDTKTENNSTGNLSKKEILHDFVLKTCCCCRHGGYTCPASPHAGSFKQNIFRFRYRIHWYGIFCPIFHSGGKLYSLRLNWRRTNNGELSTTTTTTAGEYYLEPGSWLFECGECTQVREFPLSLFFKTKKGRVYWKSKDE